MWADRVVGPREKPLEHLWFAGSVRGIVGVAEAGFFVGAAGPLGVTSAAVARLVGRFEAAHVVRPSGPGSRMLARKAWRRSSPLAVW